MASGGKAPPAPDYKGAAEQTAAGNLENIKWQTEANRVNQFTPWGSSTWIQAPSPDGGKTPGKWTQNVSLTPETADALASQQQIQKNQSSLAQALQAYVSKQMNGGLSTPSLTSYTDGVPGVDTQFGGFDRTGTGNVDLDAPQFTGEHRQQAIDAAYKASTGLLQDGWDQDNKGLDEKLRLQGLTPGTEAYNNAMQNQLRVQGQQKDALASTAVLTGDQIANSDFQSELAGYGARNTAQGQQFGQALAGYGADSTAQQNSNTAQEQAYRQALSGYGTAYQDALQKYLQPLNSMNAVLTGQQVQSPTFPGYASAGVANGPDYSGAMQGSASWAQGMYNADQASAASTNSMIAGLGAAGIGAAAFMF